MTQQVLLNHIEIPEANLHRMACEADPEIGAEKYAELLRELFPNADILAEEQRWTAPVYVPHLDSWRISLTLPAINAARHVAFLVSGRGKASILKEVFENPTSNYPVQHVTPQGELTWFIDHDAGQLLKTVGG